MTSLTSNCSVITPLSAASSLSVRQGLIPVARIDLRAVRLHAPRRVHRGDVERDRVWHPLFLQPLWLTELAPVSVSVCTT